MRVFLTYFFLCDLFLVLLWQAALKSQHLFPSLILFLFFVCFVFWQTEKGGAGEEEGAAARRRSKKAKRKERDKKVSLDYNKSLGRAGACRPHPYILTAVRHSLMPRSSAIFWTWMLLLPQSFTV